MNFKKLFASLTPFEWGLWLFSLVGVLICTLLSPDFHLLGMLASLLGVTSLIFIAKGAWQGQILIVIFATLYGIVSFEQRYFGEMITYLCMTLPMAVICLVSWFRHPYKETSEVKINSLRPAYLAILVPLSAAVSVGLYFLLGALGTQNLVISTLSVTTSFFAASLTFLRTPYFALAYAVNDVVLITLWVDASLKSPAYISMVVCFFVFLINDTYSFINWMKMRRRQRAKM
jgi:nicotinamide mononucleotide transporter PnuC